MNQIMKKKQKTEVETKKTLKVDLRNSLYTIIFESNTTAGKWFDILLLWAILLSSVTVMLESVESIELQAGEFLRRVEFLFTLVFTLEYFIRIYSARNRIKYIVSFFGIIDLLAILPTYTALFIGGVKYLIIVRTFRLLRVYRIFKLSRYLQEGSVLLRALKASRYKIILFLGVVFSIVITMGTVMYVVEGKENGFSSIPQSIYWAIVTLTTVGYGDIAPKTVIGQTISSIVMILGYAIIAVPTGIVSAELTRESHTTQVKCKECGADGHSNDASYCRICGAGL
jgi:voltage-gated potassium channel